MSGVAIGGSGSARVASPPQPPKRAAGFAQRAAKLKTKLAAAAADGDAGYAADDA